MRGRKSNLKSLVFEWLGGWRKRAEHGQANLVSDDENNRRSATCVSCPHQISIAGGCGSCRRALAGLRRAVLKDRVPDVRLNACGILATDTQVMNLLDEGPVHNDALPAHCWKKA